MTKSDEQLKVIIERLEANWIYDVEQMKELK